MVATYLHSTNEALNDRVTLISHDGFKEMENKRDGGNTLISPARHFSKCCSKYLYEVNDPHLSKERTP